MFEGWQGRLSAAWAFHWLDAGPLSGDWFRESSSIVRIPTCSSNIDANALVVGMRGGHAGSFVFPFIELLVNYSL